MPLARAAGMIVAMRRRYITWLALLCLLAAVLGFAAAPHYRPPAESGEARLRARAVQFYRAQLSFDFWGIAQCYTPAQQLAQASKLADFAASRASQRQGFDEATLKDLQRSADTVTADKLTVQIEGDWAVTGGTVEVVVEGGQVPYPLEQEVWVRTGGEWWMYSMSNEEMAAYGNPPDFARQLLTKRKPGPGAPPQINIKPNGQAPAAGNQPTPQPGAAPKSGTAPKGTNAAPGVADGQGAGKSTGGG